MKIHYPATVIIAALFLAITNSANCQELSYKLSNDARQQIYIKGVPHIDNNGKIINEYRPGQSFFPILLYHATDFLDAAETIPTPFDKLRSAGFNGVHTTAFTKSGMTQAYMDRLHKNGLRMVKCVAEEKDVKQFASHPSMLAWDVIDEPDALGDFDQYPSKFEYYDQHLKMIREYDKIHPVFVNNVAWILDPNLVWWTKWQQTSGIACHDNYPVGPTQSDSWSRNIGIPESVSLAVKVTDEKKPVWFIAQAFSEDKPTRWAMPTTVELRSMVYTAVIHGATAMDYFVMDNNIVRGAGLYGISPEPREQYTAGSGVSADSSRLKQIKQLWNTASKINHEIEDLTPWILSPTSSANYHVSIRGESKTRTPIRTILKRYKDQYVLLAVNIDNVPIDMRIDFENKLGFKNAKAMYEKRRNLELSNSTLDDRFEPFDVHIYKFSKE